MCQDDWPNQAVQVLVSGSFLIWCIQQKQKMLHLHYCLSCAYERAWGTYKGAVNKICNTVRVGIRTTNRGLGYSPGKLKTEFGIDLVFKL